MLALHGELDGRLALHGELDGLDGRVGLHGELDGRVGDEHEGGFGAVPQGGDSLLHPDLT